MDQWIADLLAFIKANQGIAGLVIFALAFAESLAFFSLVVPFTSTILGAGALVCGPNSTLDPWIILPWGIAGAAAGDALSYWIGRYFDDKIPKIWPFKNDPALLERGHRFFARWGVLSVFIGRFFGPLRAVVPVVAGMMDMPHWRFQAANVVSAIVWLPALLIPGCIIGEVFSDVANLSEKVFGYVFIFFFGASIAGGLIVWARSRMKKAAARRSGSGKR